MDLYLHEKGSSQNPAIVFLHGGGLSGRMWAPQMEAFSREYYCLAPDLPEQGRSAQIKPFELESSSAAVAELIRARCLDQQAYIVGLSLGGALALTLLRSAPELCLKVLVSGTSGRLSSILGAVSIASARLYRYMNSESLVKASVKQFGIPKEYQADFREDLLIGASEEFTVNFTRALMNFVMPQNVETPLLVAVGGKETFVAKKAARGLVKEIPGSQGVLVPKVGHVWNLQEPQLFNQMLKAWIEEKALPAQLESLG